MKRFEDVRISDTGINAFEGLSIEDQLKKHIVDGIKKSLESRLETALETYTPLEIINTILLDGMKTVGELFGSGKMQLPFVLQSAEVMKAVKKFLRKFSRTPARMTTAPGLGEHTRMICRDLARLSDETIASLESEGAFQ